MSRKFVRLPVEEYHALLTRAGIPIPAPPPRARAAHAKATWAAPLIIPDEAIAAARVQMRTILTSLNATDVTKENMSLVVAAARKLTEEQQVPVAAVIARSDAANIAFHNIDFSKWMSALAKSNFLD